MFILLIILWKSVYIINCDSELCLIYWIVFKHFKSGLTHFYTVNCFLGLTDFWVYFWYFPLCIIDCLLDSPELHSQLIEWRIFILYFKNKSDLRKVFESSIHPPLELGLNLILQLASELGSWILVKISIHCREQVTFCWRCLY